MCADKIIFKVPGPPQGKARARTFYDPGKGKYRSITPEDTVLYENLIKACYMEAARGERFEDGDAIAASITAYYQTPKSASKKKQSDMLFGAIRPTKKPDADNVLKAVLDALNGIAYRDDTQIVEASIAKYYGAVPGLTVTLTRLAGEG